MDSYPPRCFGRKRPVHEVLGGGFIADVILWRRGNLTIGLLLGPLAAWVVFQVSGYTLMSLVSNALLLLISILFVWAKAASVLNRPPPPIPELHLSEEFVNEIAVLVRSTVNVVLTAFHDIALGKDWKLFCNAAVCFWLVSIVGSWTGFLTWGYTSLLVLLTAPVLYEKYEDTIDRYMTLAYVELLLYEKIYERTFEECIDKIKNWILEKQKELS